MSRSHRSILGLVVLLLLAGVFSYSQVMPSIPGPVSRPAHGDVPPPNPPAPAEPLPPSSPLGISFFAPVQFPPMDWSVNGLRLNILYADNEYSGFIDIGAGVSVTRMDEYGLEVTGLWNEVGRDCLGLQFAGIGNNVHGNFTGLQLAGLINQSGASSLTSGIQIACFNIAGDADAFQIGVFNRANELNGLQIGVVNVNELMQGMQIGVVNYSRSSVVPFFPIINMCF